MSDVIIPQAGHVYVYDNHLAVNRNRYQVFVIGVSAGPHAWDVRGVLVTDSYTLTDEGVLASGSVGPGHADAFCALVGVGGEGGQVGLYSRKFPASDASDVGRAERKGRLRYLTGEVPADA